MHILGTVGSPRKKQPKISKSFVRFKICHTGVKRPLQNLTSLYIKSLKTVHLQMTKGFKYLKHHRPSPQWFKNWHISTNFKSCNTSKDLVLQMQTPLFITAEGVKYNIYTIAPKSQLAEISCYTFSTDTQLISDKSTMSNGKGRRFMLDLN